MVNTSNNLGNVLCTSNNDLGNVVVSVFTTHYFMECSERHKDNPCCRDADDVRWHSGLVTVVADG